MTLKCEVIIVSLLYNIFLKEVVRKINMSLPDDKNFITAIEDNVFILFSSGQWKPIALPICHRLSPLSIWLPQLSSPHNSQTKLNASHFKLSNELS